MTFNLIRSNTHRFLTSISIAACDSMIKASYFATLLVTSKSNLIGIRVCAPFEDTKRISILNPFYLKPHRRTLSTHLLQLEELPHQEVKIFCLLVSSSQIYQEVKHKSSLNGFLQDVVKVKFQ